jgi:hypothetical protein
MAVTGLNLLNSPYRFGLTGAAVPLSGTTAKLNPKTEALQSILISLRVEPKKCTDQLPPPSTGILSHQSDLPVVVQTGLLYRLTEAFKIERSAQPSVAKLLLYPRVTIQKRLCPLLPDFIETSLFKIIRSHDHPKFNVCVES